ncbi:hypothetical protein L6R52_31045 [Myxococcota bacterium]|nr:hypothetical protein [Myxococcota bacterium]
MFLSAPELLAVVDELLRTRTDAELRALVDAMAILAARFEDELELLETIPAGDERDEVAARVKFDCPLLADGACTVYRARELNARTFGQTWDRRRGAAYGCGLTHERLRILGPDVGTRLVDARDVRRRLVDAVPGTERVHVYPWWFARIGALLVDPPR